MSQKRQESPTGAQKRKEREIIDLIVPLFRQKRKKEIIYIPAMLRDWEYSRGRVRWIEERESSWLVKEVCS